MDYHWPDFTLAEVGFAEQRALFERISRRDGAPPPVIDSDDLLSDPEKTVHAYCDASQIPYIADALAWEPGDRAEVSWYDKGSWHDNLRNSNGIKPQKRAYPPVESSDRLMRMYEECLPHYQALRHHRVGAL